METMRACPEGYDESVSFGTLKVTGIVGNGRGRGRRTLERSPTKAPRRNRTASSRARIFVFRFPKILALELAVLLDRKSTRLNSSHTVISYAVFCLKKKKKKKRYKIYYT